MKLKSHFKRDDFAPAWDRIFGCRFQISVFKIEGVCGAEKSVLDKKEINIYILIKLYNIYII
jgi:hypothetical protein